MTCDCSISQAVKKKKVKPVIRIDIIYDKECEVGNRYFSV